MRNKSLLKKFFATTRQSRFCLIGAFFKNNINFIYFFLILGGGTGSLCVSSPLRKLKGVYIKT